MDWQKIEKIVPELAGELQALRAAASNLNGAFRNRAFTNNNATAPTPVTAGMLLNYAAIALQVKASGIFQVSMAWSASGLTAAAATTVAVTTQTQAVAIPLTNATAIGVSGLIGTPPTPIVASAAGGILVTGGPFSSTTQSSEVITTATAQTTLDYSWSGLVGASIGNNPPQPGFPSGNFVTILFAINSGTSSATLASLSFGAYELP
jgi:hypothetical protein